MAVITCDKCGKRFAGMSLNDAKKKARKHDKNNHVE